MITMMNVKIVSIVDIVLNVNFVRSVRFAITAKAAQKRTMLIIVRAAKWLVSVKIVVIVNGAPIV